MRPSRAGAGRSGAPSPHRLAHLAAPPPPAAPPPLSWPPAGAFTNQIQKGFDEPRLLVVTDPRTDHQSIKEAAYMNIPVIAFCDTDSDLQVRRAAGRRAAGGRAACGGSWEIGWSPLRVLRTKRPALVPLECTSPSSPPLPTHT